MTTPAAPGSPGTPDGPRRPGGQGGGPRRRKPPQRAEVVSVTPVSGRLVSVLVSGDDLSGFADAAPTSHLKVFLPAEGQDAPLLPEFTPDGVVFDSGGPRPVVRTYTPLRYDPSAGTLEIWFVLHGDGPAAAWAQRARPGDKLAVAGPGGRFSLDPMAAHWWLAADESAIPALVTLLDALPESVTVDAHIEVDGPDDEVELAGPAKASVTWHHRRPGDYGGGLAAAARAAEIPGDARAWVACEAAAMRDIRRFLTRERGIGLDRLITRGYWRAGEQNHPDGDYGDD